METRINSIIFGVARYQLALTILITGVVIAAGVSIMGINLFAVSSGLLVGGGSYYCFRTAFNRDPQKYENKQAEMDRDLEKHGL